MGSGAKARALRRAAVLCAPSGAHLTHSAHFGAAQREGPTARRRARIGWRRSAAARSRSGAPGDGLRECRSRAESCCAGECSTGRLTRNATARSAATIQSLQHRRPSPLSAGAGRAEAHNLRFCTPASSSPDAPIPASGTLRASQIAQSNTHLGFMPLSSPAACAS